MFDVKPTWLYVVAIVAITIIILDEVAYRTWKFTNPGSMYPSAYRNVDPPIKPPWEIY